MVISQQPESLQPLPPQPASLQTSISAALATTTSISAVLATASSISAASVGAARRCSLGAAQADPGASSRAPEATTATYVQ